MVKKGIEKSHWENKRKKESIKESSSLNQIRKNENTQK